MRRQWVTVPALAACVLTLTGLLAGCGDAAGNQGNKIVLQFSWWGNADRATVTNKAVEVFERRHPHIEVQTSFSSYNSYVQKLATQAAGGNTPDVMQLDYRQISQYASAGVLAKLGRRPEIGTSEIDRGLLRTGQVRGMQYALPMGRGTQVIAYDSGMWRRAGVPEPRFGWTWQDWADAMRTLRAATGKVGATDPGWSEDWFEVWLRGRGKQLYTNDGRLGFTVDDLAEYWRWCSELRKQGAVSPASQTTQLDGSAQNTPLGRGRAVSDFNWDAPSSAYGATVGDDLRLAPMPVGPTGKPGQYFKPSMLIGVSANTAHSAAAAELVDFMINDPVAGSVLGVSRGMPVNRTIRERIKPSLTGFDREISMLQSALEGKLADPPSAPPQGDVALQRTFQRDYDQVSFTRLSPHAAAAQFVSQARAELTR